jgi:Tol biopolymer transport system component
MRRLALSTALAALALIAVPAAGQATFIPGPNGKIAFSSGRLSPDVPITPADDSQARIWVADFPNGPPRQVTTLPAMTHEAVPQPAQHRHPNWSPDHTRIVYAAGKAFGGKYALWIVDLRTGAQTEFVPEAPKQDRPSWSPDGTMIAYGSNGDIFVKAVNGLSAPVQLTETANVEERPVWSPDGNTLYYNREIAATNRDIWKKTPVTKAGAETPVVTAAGEDWQPAVSPDGSRLCYLHGPQSNEATLRTVNVNGTGDALFLDDPGLGDLNCVWSPDGTRILYTEGAFTSGELRSRDVNGGGLEMLAGMNVAAHFDGNVDWATNLRPKCDAKTLGVQVNSLTRIPLTCTDPDAGFDIEPPTPTPLESEALEVVSRPTHGTIGGLVNGVVAYTPNKDFEGTDTFAYTGTDDASSAAPATVTINVGAGRDTTAPSVSGVKLSRKRFRRGTKAGISPTPIGTTISFRLSEAARTTLTFKRMKSGKRAGSLSVSGKAGLNHVRFRGRLRRTRFLAPGRYKLVLSAKDAAGNRSKPLGGPTFTIVPELGAL